MMEKVIGYIEQSEREQMEDILEKKRALENLLKITEEEKEEAFFEEVKKDYLQTKDDYLKWWDDISVKYGWEGKQLRIELGDNAMIEMQA